MTTVLSIQGLEKVYKTSLFKKPVHALRGLDLEVEPGETYGFLGLNGAGKTTTFKLILGLLRPTRGQGELLGRPLGHRESLRHVGFLPELPAYYPHLSGAEVLSLARDLAGIGQDRRQDEALLERLGIGFAMNRPVRRMSKGQVQRVGLAQSIVHDPEFLILDEPMSGLDPLARALVKDCLREQKSAGKAVLLSTHVLADLEALADRVGMLQNGRMLRTARTAELLADSVREVRIEGWGALPESAWVGLPAEPQWSGGDPWSLVLRAPSPDIVDACLRRIIDAGGRIGNVESVRDDLESAFVRAMEGGEEEGLACAS